jgi:hypothetical protein
MLAMCALAGPGVAWGGGWATVELDRPVPSAAPGEPIDLELTILQHGRTPLEGVRPSVTVSRTDGTGGMRRTFPARATGQPGVYAARIAFAEPGVWRYSVDDGFTARHSFPPVKVDRATGSASGGGDGPSPWPIAAAAAVALLGVGFAVRHRHGRMPAMAADGR